MFLVKPGYEILNITKDPLKLIERAGRTAYKSEDKTGEGSEKPFVRKLVHSLKHESVIEHASATVILTIDRGVSHELVRHRIAAYTQESTRFCNYGKKGVTFVIPPWLNYEPGVYTEPNTECEWYTSMLHAEASYLKLLDRGWKPQRARSVLPNSLKTDIVVTYNFRQWRHVMRLRMAPEAHEQMQEIMKPLLVELDSKIPVIFEDLTPKEEKAND